MAPETGRRVVILSVTALVFASCGGGSPAAPSGAVVQSLFFVPEIRELAVGETVDLTLVVAFTDGSRAQMSPAWNSDNAAVLHVQPMSAIREAQTSSDNPNKVIDHILVGRLTGISEGEARVSAACQHGRAEQRVRVIRR